MAKPRTTEDGHYVVINGRKWRASDPSLSAKRRHELVDELMAARRSVKATLKNGDKPAERLARNRVNAAKVALGERGEPWWER